MKTLATICAAFLLAAAPAMHGGKSPQADKLLEGARHKEVIDGDLKAAIEQYRKIAAQFRKDPEVAAKALFQMGQCQEKLGWAEARKSYERILREYGGAQQYASAARARLAALGGGVEPGQSTRAVWTGPKVDGYNSSVSRDGRFISFPDWDTGNLGLRDLVTGTDRLLTTTGSHKRPAAFAEGSAISRDGKQVAYAWFNHELGRFELRVLDLSGVPAPRRVFEKTDVTYVEPRDWSPDGKWILANLWHEQNSRIAMIGVDDGSLRVLKSGTDRPQAGALSPDGRFIVYTRGTPVSQGYVISPDGRTEAPLVSGSSSAQSPVWTLDGSRVLFISGRSGSPGLWAVRVEEGKPLGEPELLKAGVQAWLKGFTRDGSLLYDIDLYLTDIYVAALDPGTGKLTSEPKRVNERAIGNTFGRVAWLPDGNSLSFWTRGPMGALMTQELSTAAEREIWGGRTGRPTYGYTGWFPDGSMMVWDRSQSKTWTFRRQDSRAGEIRQSWTVTAPQAPVVGGGGNPIFSADLMTMYFWERDPEAPCDGPKCTYVIRSRNIETGLDREIYRMRANSLSRTSISRDGRHVTFIAEDGLAQLIMVAPTAGGTAHELFRSTDDLRATGTTWTRDGARVLVFCVRSNGKGGEVWSLPVTGGQPEKSPLRILPTEAPAVSPDGTRVAFVGGSEKSEIWAMSGLFPEAKPAAAPRR
jgi:Tol biopolymer transport system component